MFSLSNRGMVKLRGAVSPDETSKRKERGLDPG